MSRRQPARLPAATIGTGDVVHRAGTWREVVRVSAGHGLFAGLVELHTAGPYIRPWPLEVDASVPVLLEPGDARVAS